MSDPVCRCRTFALDASQARAYRNEPGGEVWFVHTPVWCGSAPAPGSASPPAAVSLRTAEGHPISRYDGTYLSGGAASPPARGTDYRASETIRDLILGRHDRVSVGDVEHLRDSLASAEARAEAAERSLDEARADVIAAAGELLVPVPPPGSDAARLLTANVLMRRERDEARAALSALREALRDALRYGLPPHDVSGRAAWDRATRALLGGGDAGKGEGER